MLLGSSLSLLWGTMRVMQTIVLFVSLREVPLPANANVFLGVFVEIQAIDLTRSEDLYNMWFEFIYTPPYNERFEHFKIDSMNFIMNQGSYLIYFVIIIIFNVLLFVLNKIALRCRRVECCRKFGVKINKKNYWHEIKAQNWKLFIEQYYEILLAATLGFISLFEGIDKFFGSTKLYNFICSLLTVTFVALCVYFPIWASRVLLETQKSSTNKLKMYYSVLYSDVTLKTRMTAMFHVIILYHKAVIVVMLVFLHEWPNFQFFLFLILETLYFAQLFVANPFLNKVERSMEVKNILAILVTVYCSHTFSYTGISPYSQ